MATAFKVKITVLKKLVHRNFTKKYRETLWNPCVKLKVGQEFVSDGDMPSGFCSWAWVDIQKYVLTLARGGNFMGAKPGLFVTCCTDGFRPVIFKLERILLRSRLK